MNTSETLQILHRANPRAQEGFAHSVDAVADQVRTNLVTTPPDAGIRNPITVRRLMPVSAAAAVVAATVVAALTLGGPGGRTGVEDAAAAVKKAAAVTADAAEQSGTAVVRITHDGEVWGGTTIRWHDGNLAVSRDVPSPESVKSYTAVRAGTAFIVVDGILYGPDPGQQGDWLVFGDPANVDPDTGTSPGEYAGTVRKDVGGVTLRRITGGMAGLTADEQPDGTTVYRGSVPAGLIAMERGIKDGQPIRVLPFGYVAHGEAADPNAPLDIELTVGPADVLRRIAVSWQPGWMYTITYSDLGATADVEAPKNAQPLKRRPASP